jgi:Mg2+ and Co2+ transporter CorA
MRDTLQLHIAEKSSAESRRSIKQAISVSRVTFLAFIFLPLSLVTSFFGMNIRELNGNGPQIRSFLIATGSVTAVMLVCWFLWVFTG